MSIDCCGDTDRSRALVSGVPVKKRWVDLGEAFVKSVTQEQGEWRSTPTGSAPQKYIVSFLATGVKIDRSQSLFATITEGFAWDAFEGAIEDIRKLGVFLRLVVNPSNVSGRFTKCR
jgi:hypothetical protein